MLIIRGLAKSSITLLAICALSACGDWPPLGEDIAAYVHERKSKIETLVSEFRGSEFGRIMCDRCWRDDVELEGQTISYKFIDGQWHQLENPQGEHFAELIKAAGVSAIFQRSGGETELEIAVSSGTHDPHYVIQLFHDPNHSRNDYKECVDEFKKIGCGWCKVTIDDKLWIRYGWWPDDPDPEAARARDSGEISWDEWVQRKDKALEVCETNGLLKQGYRPPVGQ